jgi:hypothetical protein
MKTSQRFMASPAKRDQAGGTSRSYYANDSRDANDFSTGNRDYCFHAKMW